MSYDTLEYWAKQNEPSTSMHWHAAFFKQIERWQVLGARIGQPLFVVNTHRSKSIDLPVVRVETATGHMLLRDNFYDVNIHVDSEVPLVLDMALLHEPMTWDQYLHDVERCRGYRYRDWTDKQMDDPCVLRVRAERTDGTFYWSEVSGAVKDRWIMRMNSPEWYCRDWSSAELLTNGVFGPDSPIYVARRAFSEGLPDAGVYRPPSSRKFTAAVDHDKTDAVVDAVLKASTEEEG